jgi:endonuclease/exonuclease/phosphatase family metal-dependent hydrolase
LVISHWIESILQNILHVATFNIHKGFSHFNAHFALHRQRDFLRKLHADIIFLQEVQELHTKRVEVTSTSGHLEYLADSVWSDYAYGKNAVYPAGHHGNALLSKFPISISTNENISAHRIERRGMLHCQINIPGWEGPLHTVCVHLGLLARWRQQQLKEVADYVEQVVPHTAPLIIAGDFNDWSGRAGQMFAKRLDVHEVFEYHTGKLARSFPACLPMLRMDRIYVRGFDVKHVEIHSGAQFVKVSDHAILSAQLMRR